MDDLISRQAAIEALERKKDKKAKGDMGGFYNKIIQNDIDALMQLPPVDQWIPCSERLPEEGEEVLCQCVADIRMVLKYTNNGEWYQDANHTYMRGFVLAWMPLPEPYKADMRGEQNEPTYR